MPDFVPEPERLALGIRQPWAELIIRGEKSVEVRNQNTTVRGTIYVYSAKLVSNHPCARDAIDRFGLDLDALPRGVLIGTVNLDDSRPANPALDAESALLTADALRQQYAWSVSGPSRFETPVSLNRRPYGIWFYPFRPETPR